jgi:hypothetical protein
MASSAFVCVRLNAACETWPVRWDALFDDLEAQLAAAEAAELAGEVSDRSRREVARVRLADRVRHGPGATLTVGLAGAGVVTGRLTRSGPDWWLLARDPGDLLVCAAAVTWVSGLPALAGDPDAAPVVSERLGLSYALRGIARDRAAVTLVLRDGASLTGTIDRVGADFVDLAEHAPGEARRAATVRGARTVPTAALAVVRTG